LLDTMLVGSPVIVSRTRPIAAIRDLAA